MGLFDRWRRRDAFGVVARPAPREARPGPGATARVRLEDPGDSKIAIIKLAREAGGLSLRDAKDLVDHPPSLLPVHPERRDDLVVQLRAAGARAEAAG